MIIDSIEYIYDGQQFHYAKESTEAELIEFVESLNREQFAKIEEFFDNLPKLNKKIEIKCGKCGFDHTIEVEGLESFFG
jgi:Ni,Fe-hydrogenase III small subunit